MGIPAKWSKLTEVLIDHRSGYSTTNDAIERMATILGEVVKPAEPDVPDITFGTVFTGFFGKCIALGKPDEQGHFFVYTSKGYRDVYHISDVREVHPARTEQMQRVLVDIRDSDKWYTKAIPDDHRDPDEYTNPADLYKL